MLRGSRAQSAVPGQRGKAEEVQSGHDDAKPVEHQDDEDEEAVHDAMRMSLMAAYEDIDAGSTPELPAVLPAPEQSGSTTEVCAPEEEAHDAAGNGLDFSVTSSSAGDVDGALRSNLSDSLPGEMAELGLANREVPQDRPHAWVHARFRRRLSLVQRRLQSELQAAAEVSSDES